MNDMTQVIVPKSDQLNSDDLIGGPRTITITAVTIRPGTEQPVSIHFDGDNNKPWKTCKSMNRVLVTAWGPDASVYVGRSVTIYRDPAVKWGGMAVGGIRISHLSHIERDMQMALTETKGKRSPFLVKVLQNAPAAKATDPNAAEKWANDHIGFVQGAADIARLDAVEASGTKAMAKLAGSNPELHTRVTEAYAKRRAELTDDDPFGEGPSDDQRGEQVDETIADKLIARIEAATVIADVLTIETEYQNVAREMLEIPDQDRVEKAIDDAKKQMKGEVK